MLVQQQTRSATRAAYHLIRSHLMATCSRQSLIWVIPPPKILLFPPRQRSWTHSISNLPCGRRKLSSSAIPTTPQFRTTIPASNNSYQHTTKPSPAPQLHLGLPPSANLSSPLFLQQQHFSKSKRSHLPPKRNSNEHLQPARPEGRSSEPDGSSSCPTTSIALSLQTNNAPSRAAPRDLSAKNISKDTKERIPKRTRTHVNSARDLSVDLITSNPTSNSIHSHTRNPHALPITKRRRRYMIE
jgi:hypothetical protein